MPDSGRISAQDYPGPLTAAERRQIDAQRAAQEIIGGDPLVPFDLAGVAREVVSLRAEVERLRAALRPFVDEAALGHHNWGRWVPTPPDDEVEVWVTAAQMQRAADALNGGQSAG